jgi:hypothetical protein
LISFMVKWAHGSKYAARLLVGLRAPAQASFLKATLDQMPLFVRPAHSPRPQIEPPANHEIAVAQDLRFNAPLAVYAELARPRDVIDANLPDRLAGLRLSRRNLPTRQTEVLIVDHRDER